MGACCAVGAVLCAVGLGGGDPMLWAAGLQGVEATLTDAAGGWPQGPGWARSLVFALTIFLQEPFPVWPSARVKCVTGPSACNPTPAPNPTHPNPPHARMQKSTNTLRCLQGLGGVVNEQSVPEETRIALGRCIRHLKNLWKAGA